MAKVALPRYVSPRKLAGGRIAYYWVRPSWAKPPAERHGKTCPVGTTPLGSDLAEVIARAEPINTAFDQWRAGGESRVVPGTVRWLFRWYREEERYKAVRHKTRKEYRALMDFLEAEKMKVGTFGDKRAGIVDASTADKLYARLRESRGERQAAYMMSLCRTVWGWAARHSKVTGVKDNPFAKMGIRSKAVRGVRPSSRAEYELYKETARAMGFQSMAAAAALCFEGCQRVWDVFGFEDPDRRIERGIRWDGYREGEHLALIQSKTGNEVTIPLYDGSGADRVSLYPELEEEIARVGPRRPGELIVIDERTGERFTLDRMQKLHTRIRKKAKLPAGFTFTGFRHGGITELGDSGEEDVRPISGHSTLQVTAIYNKASREKARRIAARRREHVKFITEGEGDPS